MIEEILIILCGSTLITSLIVLILALKRVRVQPRIEERASWTDLIDEIRKNVPTIANHLKLKEEQVKTLNSTLDILGTLTKIPGINREVRKFLRELSKE